MHRTTCRGCGNTNLTPVIDLGDQYFQGCFIKDTVQRPTVRKTPNQIVRCDTSSYQEACGLIQTKHTVDPDILYSNYWYQSGISQTMRDHLSSIVESAMNITGCDSGNVLDIASNDNTLLRNYPGTFNKFGIDPSDIAAKQNDSDITVINTTFPSSRISNIIQPRSCNIISSIACYYDIDDPVEFASCVKGLLAKKGVWVFEVAYWKSMLDNMAYDSIVNEHIIHYHLHPLIKILELAGMRIFDTYKTSTNGGSILCYATHQDNFDHDTSHGRSRILNMKIDEFDAKLDTDEPYDKFRSDVSNHKNALTSLINNIVHGENKTIHICGASTKLNTILNYCNIGPDLIPFAAERSPEKHGAQTISGIKLISEEDSRAMKPDYYLVGPYHFKDEILKREAKAISEGTKFIFPLPQLTVN